MPATGLKIFGTGTGHTYHGVTTSSFQNSLTTSGAGHQDYMFWNLVPFLPDLGFQLLKSLWSSLTYFV